MDNVTFDDEFISRFWSRVTKTNNCWLWNGAKKDSNYGLIIYKGERFTTHRVSYILHMGNIPEQLLVLHKCDSLYAPGDITYRRCVNPDHLYAGTTQQNSQDMARSKRSTIGERNPKSILTIEEVREIRAKYARGGITQRKLAIEYEMSNNTISMIITNKRWKGEYDLCSKG